MLNANVFHLGAVVEILLLNFGLGRGLKFLQEHNFFCYIFNLEHRLFSISPLLYLPHVFSITSMHCFRE